MPTSQYVDSGFWNFDALFVPQQHPARDLQDTFYISGQCVAHTEGQSKLTACVDPPSALPPPQDYYERVSKVHSEGGYGSTGYRAPWVSAESSRLLLRTHTTACSANLLRQLAERKGGFKPVKMFSIDRVFRNEAVDMTHLAEFHQVEGVVADRGLTLADLIGAADDV